MPSDPVEKIANALLYEGYILYPYRASAVKNRQRFNFGALYPPAHRLAQSGNDSDTMQIECLVVRAGGGADAVPRVDARVRFLQLRSRDVYRLASPSVAVGLNGPNDLNGLKVEPNYTLVDSLVADGHVHQTWQEAVERDINLSGIALTDLVAQSSTVKFSLPADSACEEILASDGAVAGRVVRRQQEISGTVALGAERLANSLWKLRLGIHNATPLAEQALADRDEMLLSTLISTHAILRVADAEFVSLLEPPDEFLAAANECRNVGAWPVLAGEPGQRARLLASPIILYDYPQVAPESSGDWFDGAEIDEMLMLRVMTLTGDEKRAMRDVDRRAREILERTEAMTEEQMLKLHGAFRGLERGGALPSGEEALR